MYLWEKSIAKKFRKGNLLLSSHFFRQAAPKFVYKFIDSKNISIMYLNRVGACTMAGSHVAVALCDGCADGQVAVLAVHVVCAGSGGDFKES